MVAYFTTLHCFLQELIFFRFLGIVQEVTLLAVSPDFSIKVQNLQFPSADVALIIVHLLPSPEIADPLNQLVKLIHGIGSQSV